MQQKEAMFYEKKKDKIVQCHLCPKHCIIKPGARGNCLVRENQKGKLIALTYGRPCSLSIDPIEKKPLFHFLPASSSLSYGTAGCNLHCKHCQNWEISQYGPEDVPSINISPKEIVEKAIEEGCESISYTYNDPIVFYEFVLDTAKIARKKGLKNVIVCSGFINQEPLKEWCKVIDAANIDLKYFNDKTYRSQSTAWLQPVLDSIITIKKKKLWLEITNIIIPTINDNMDEIKQMCEWIKTNLGDKVPLHFTAFYPCYKLMDIPATKPDTLRKAKRIADKTGLKYVYLGNIFAEKDSSTRCHECNEIVVERGDFFQLLSNNIKSGKCVNKHKIPGVWE